MSALTAVRYAAAPKFIAAKPHSAEFLAEVVAPGPNGKTFFSGPVAATLEGTSIATMFDGVTVADLPSGYSFYAGYWNGSFANLTALRQTFPHATVVTITPDGAQGAMYIDVEPGDAVNSQIAAFVKAGGTGFYTAGSNLQAAIDACTAAGLSRSDYKIWSAHWIGNHICAPGTCGYPQADGTQYQSTAGWDESAITLPGFLGNSTPVPEFPVKPGAKDATATGGPVWTIQRGLNKWAQQIKLTKELATDGSFGPDTAAAVKLAHEYWDYSAENVALGEVDQSLWNHLWNNPPVTSWAYEAPQSLTARGGRTSVSLAWKAPSGSVPAGGTPWKVPVAYRINMYTEAGELVWQRSTTKLTVLEGGLPRKTKMFARVWGVGAPAFSSGHYAEVAFTTS
jgi:hypothetical protein